MTTEQYSGLSVVERNVCICGWPTAALEIDHINSSDNDAHHQSPHTLIIFIPGNPGVIHWYIDIICQIVDQLGSGYAARGVSYAGHGVGEHIVGTRADHRQSFYSEHLPNNDCNEPNKEGRRNMSVAWTMAGQIMHKEKWFDGILQDWKINHPASLMPQLVFISHSIGAHFVQSLLLMRSDIAIMTQQIIHLTPFFRYDPPFLPRLILSSGAHGYKLSVPMFTSFVKAISSTFPRSWIDLYIKKVVGIQCDKGRKIALDIFMDSAMVRNHLVLGMQEIRDLPEYPNDIALRLLSRAPSSILFCGNDQWAPEFHGEDLERLKQHSEIPNNIQIEYMKELRHDFVVRPEQIDPIAQFCFKRIKATSGDRCSLQSNVAEGFTAINLRSRL